MVDENTVSLSIVTYLSKKDMALLQKIKIRKYIFSPETAKSGY